MAPLINQIKNVSFQLGTVKLEMEKQIGTTQFEWWKKGLSVPPAVIKLIGSNALCPKTSVKLCPGYFLLPPIISSM